MQPRMPEVDFALDPVEDLHARLAERVHESSQRFPFAVSMRRLGLPGSADAQFKDRADGLFNDPYDPEGALLEHLPHLRLIDPAAVRITSGVLRGPESLPVRF